MAERHILRKALIGVAALAAVVAVAVLTAPFWLPASLVSDRIEVLVRQRTNRDLHIAGAISFSLVPKIALVAHDVTLSSPPSFSANLVEAKTVDIALDPLALLHGAVVIDRLILSQPTVNFEIDKAGERNWIFHRPQSPPGPVSAAKPPSAATFAADEIRIVDGNASFWDQRSGPKHTVSGLALTLSMPSAAGPFNATGTATVNGDAVHVSASLASLLALRGEGSSAATIKISAPRGSLGFDGEIDPSNTAKGAFDLKTPSLHGLLDWLHAGLAPHDSGDAPLSIAGKLDLAKSAATLTDATVTLGDMTAQGTLALQRTAKELELDLTNLALAGGKGTGKLVADDSGPTPSFVGSLALTGVTIRQLPIGIAGFGTLSGVGDVSLNLTASGKTTKDIVKSLGGNGSITLADGSIGSGGLAPALKNSLGPLVSDKSIPHEFAYRSLSATATIDHGILTNNDLKLSGPQAAATGTGTLDLAERRIDYLWQPDIVGLGNARVQITGAWDTPDYKIEQLNITGGAKGLKLPGLNLR